MSLTDQHAPYSLYFWLEEFQEEDDWCAVMRTAKELLHLSPDNPEGLKFLAEAFFRLNRPVEAYEAAKRLVEVFPLSLDGYWILSDLAAQADDWERCAAYIEKAARIIPNSDAIWVEVAKAYFSLGRLPECLVAADRGLRVNRQNVRLLLYKVFCLVGLRSLPGAKIAAGRLTELGMEAEDLRDVAKELGITGAALGKISRLMGGVQTVALPAAEKKKKRAEKALLGGLASLSKLSEQAAPLTPRQFEMQLKAAQQLRERQEEAEEAATAQMDEPIDAVDADPEKDVMTANMVYFVYDAYRVHGPFTLSDTTALFTDGTFSVKEAFVRRETDDEWSRVETLQELAEKITAALSALDA